METLPPLEVGLRLVAGVALILANAFFVVTEFALTRARQFSEAEFQEHPGLKRAWKMTEKLELHLTGCQLGISSTSVLLGVVFEPAITVLLHPVVGLFGLGPSATATTSIVISVVVINLIHKIWGEQAPTYLGVEAPKPVLRYFAIPLDTWTRVMYPIIFLGDGLAKWTLGLFGIEITRSWTEADQPEGEKASAPRSEFNQRLSDMLAERGIPKERRREVIRSVEIGELTVQKIMVPREEVVALTAGAPFEENARRIAEANNVRYPLVGASLDDFIGVLYLPTIFAHYDALVRGDMVLDDLDHTDMRVPPDLPVSELIDRFQEENHEVAMVWEGDRALGLVTLTDAIEAVFGEIEDPLDIAADPQD